MIDRTSNQSPHFLGSLTHPVKVVKPTPTVSGSEAFLMTTILLAGPDVGTSLAVRQLEKPLAADKTRKRGIASDACDVNRCVSYGQHRFLPLSGGAPSSRMLKDTIYREYAGECVKLK